MPNLGLLRQGTLTLASRTMHYKRAPGLEGKSLLVTPPPLCFAAQGFAPLRRRWGHRGSPDSGWLLDGGAVEKKTYLGGRETRCNDLPPKEATQ